MNTQTDTVNDTVKAENDTETELKKSLQRIYAAIKNNPEITHSKNMELLHISESTAKRANRDLRKLGYIERER